MCRNLNIVVLLESPGSSLAACMKKKNLYEAQERGFVLFIRIQLRKWRDFGYASFRGAARP